MYSYTYFCIYNLVYLRSCHQTFRKHSSTLCVKNFSQRIGLLNCFFRTRTRGLQLGESGSFLAEVSGQRFSFVVVVVVVVRFFCGQFLVLNPGNIMWWIVPWHNFRVRICVFHFVLLFIFRYQVTVLFPCFSSLSFTMCKLILLQQIIASHLHPRFWEDPLMFFRCTRRRVFYLGPVANTMSYSIHS